MTHHLPIELQRLIKDKKYTIKSGQNIFDIGVEESKDLSLVTLVLSLNEKDSDYDACHAYFTFKNELWFQTTYIDSEGLDYIDGGVFGQYTPEQIRKHTKNTVDRLVLALNV